MSCSSECVSSSTSLSSNLKLFSFEATLHQNISEVFKDIVKDFEEFEDYKKQFYVQKEKCKSKSCSSSEQLIKVIESKNTIIQLVVSTLTKLYETKNLSILDDVFKILSGDTTVTVPNLEIKDTIDNVKFEVLTPKKEVFNNITCKDESVSEIEGTPTGRVSPIIHTKKTRNYSNNSSSDFREKKKCPDEWSTSDNKAVKLTFPTPPRSKSRANVKLRQGRLNLIKLKTNSVVDLTTSPELMTVNRCSQNNRNVQPLIKKESTDNDDTILPSPTSGPNNFTSLYKSTTTNSPIKFNKPSLGLKSNNEITPVKKSNLENTPTKNVLNVGEINEGVEESINLLRPRFIKNMDEHSPIKLEPLDNDETHFEIPSSLSILNHVEMLEKEGINVEPPKLISPSKRPLAENKNLTNMPQEDTESSISLLRQDTKTKVSPTDKVKRPITLSCKRPPPVEPVYKEVVPRTKVEKRKLRGWNCDECKHFFDDLYQNDPEMLAKKMDECSKHRGKSNPARPKTPEGFWNPRWSVPSDTEEFNKRNNAD